MLARLTACLLAFATPALAASPPAVESTQFMVVSAQRLASEAPSPSATPRPSPTPAAATSAAAAS